jgi:hypothetical protein
VELERTGGRVSTRLELARRASRERMGEDRVGEPGGVRRIGVPNLQTRSPDRLCDRGAGQEPLVKGTRKPQRRTVLDVPEGSYEGGGAGLQESLRQPAGASQPVPSPGAPTSVGEDQRVRFAEVPRPVLEEI